MRRGFRSSRPIHATALRLHNTMPPRPTGRCKLGLIFGMELQVSNSTRPSIFPRMEYGTCPHNGELQLTLAEKFTRSISRTPKRAVFMVAAIATQILGGICGSGF